MWGGKSHHLNSKHPPNDPNLYFLQNCAASDDRGTFLKIREDTTVSDGGFSDLEI